MQKSSFVLKPWQTSQFPQSVIYQPYLNTITPKIIKNNQKAVKKYEKLRLSSQKKYEVVDGKSILSIKLIKNRAKTYQSSSKYLQTLNFKDYKQIQSFKMKSQLKEQSSFMHKKFKQTLSMKKIIPQISKQQNIAPSSPLFKLKPIPQKLKSLQKNKKRSISSHSFDRQFKIQREFNLKEDTSSHNLLRKYWSKQQVEIYHRTKNCLIDSESRKGFFNIRSKNIQKDEDKKIVTNHKKNIEIRLKKILQKSTRKKKDFQDFVKLRIMIGKQQLANRISSSKIQHIIISDFQDMSQFDDQNIYKPLVTKQIGIFFNNNKSNQ